ncbi:MAG: basic amino acid ABC transporter substrate-binding protein [Actinobacteria bacterium]|nr:basic amino acid ABC transporter substrate-binding protein [Actinomycetota bacterium]
MRTRAIALMASVVGALLTVAGCGGGSGNAAADSTTTTTKLSVASDIPYRPFEFTNPGSAEVLGFDVDVVKAAAATFGVTDITFTKRKFDTIFLDVAQKRFDMAASSITITDERKKTVAFSDPYFNARQSIMVRTGSAIRSLADLKGKTLGAQRGTTGADAAAKVPGATVKRYELVDDAFTALANGRVEAVVNDFAVSAYATVAKPKLKVVAEFGGTEQYGLAFSKDDTSLRDRFNAGLRKIKGDGTYATIYKKWFSEAPATIP